MMFKIASDEGHRDAQFNLGLLYYLRLGVEKSITKALELFTEAAYQNNPYAQHYLGYFYEEGIVVNKSTKEASKWYERSTKHNLNKFDN